MNEEQAALLRRAPKTFLIRAFPFMHRSAGLRALFRLCHHLNCCGYPAAMLTEPGAPLPDWNCFYHDRPVDDAVVIYPEIVCGNPDGARRVVRWVLNTPGLLGGDTSYDDEEMVFVYDRQKLPEAQKATTEPLGPERVLWTGLIDPDYIYPDPSVRRTIDLSFVHKGRSLAERFPLPPGRRFLRLEEVATDLRTLGDFLRRSRTLYSYDHYSNALREAAISGCEVRTVDEQGRWHDPRTCDCALNILWDEEIVAGYAQKFRSSAFVAGFVRELRARWNLPGPDPAWPSMLPFPPG